MTICEGGMMFVFITNEHEYSFSVIPAQAGIHAVLGSILWTPASCHAEVGTA
jgi:hypothetical protein